jgi:hypothetical protein
MNYKLISFVVYININYFMIYHEADAQQFWCTIFALRPIPPLVFRVLYSPLALSHARPSTASLGMVHELMGPPHLYTIRTDEGTPIVDGRPGNPFK